MEIGRIDLLKNISFVEVAEEDADRVMKGLKGTRVKGREIVVDYADGPSSRSSRGGESSAPKKNKEKKKDKIKEQFPTDFFDEPAGKKKGKKGTKPSREERGYVAPRGKAAVKRKESEFSSIPEWEQARTKSKKLKKEDWMKFLHPKSKK